MRDGGALVLPRPEPGAPPRALVPRPARWELSNGLRVVAVHRPGLPQIAMRLVVPAGSVADPDTHPGTAALVGALLTEGSRGHGPDELNAALDRLGASLSTQVGHDFAEVDLVLLSETLAAGLDLLAEVVVWPAFAPRETERVRAETLDALRARADEPANLADDRAAEAVFGPGHPYGRLAGGTPEGVAAVARDALIAFHAARYRPAGSVLVIAGEFDPHLLPRQLEHALGAWTGEAGPVSYPADAELPRQAGRELRFAWPDAAQGEIRVAGLGMQRRSPDWVPASVANYLLGGSTITGRLGANLREDKGWTYGVRSGFAAAARRGGWAIETAVDLEVVDAALAEIGAELERFVAEPPDEQELTRAKRAMVLSLPRAFETPGRIVGRFATLEAFGLDPDYWARFPETVESVTPEAVQRMARSYFAAERLVRVVVGTP